MPGIRYFRCPRCSCSAVSLKSLFRHLHVAHGHESNWVCGLAGCMQNVRLFTSYKKHVYRRHSDILKRPVPSMNATSNTADTTGSAAETGSDTLDVLGALGETECSELSISGDSDYVKQLATLFLKWKEGRRLPESTLHEIANDVIFFVKALLEDDRLQSSVEVARIMKEVLHTDSMNYLLTTAGQSSYWKMHFPFTKPQTVILGVASNGKTETMEYVPLCDVLKSVLENVTLSGNFDHPVKLENYMCSVFDGSAFSDHTYFAGDTSKICLQLYSDEFEVCNPIGSKRGTHKLTAVYFSVLNSCANLRSQLTGINLALLVRDKHVSTYGLPKIIAPLLEDVSRLENEGIVVNKKVLKGSVFVFTGDNLSTHRMGGFKCSFSHGRICRYCMALRTEINYKHLETDYVLRSPEGHRHHLSMLSAGLPTTSLYGVRSPCALQCQGFDPTQHFPPDIMHDMHEGVLPFSLRHIIRYLISKGCFSLQFLNSCISRWKYDPSDVRNKPEAISNTFLQAKAPFKGSATQCFCLFCHLALFVGECVPSEDEVWQLYLLLRDITDIIMCRKLPVSYIAYLQRKIQLFLLDFSRLFPSVSFPCKMHYLIHYPSIMQKFGPLILLWAMRFEAKHQYFKDIARKIHNFKNLCHTLAM
ncbi:uncharacterized protein [Dermacentor andersoni]|uniref:uncharacterized protein n=1 Tax=Dermacentor andersoni TaxID=34620 RepID=UPI0021550C56|nr:uncharacterized protein LOC126516765 [Dermacentor andersoni]